VELAEARWGMPFPWIKGETGLVNVTVENLRTKPTFQRLVMRRRCLVPATGFYEWRDDPDKKRPFHFKLGDGVGFLIAGLYDVVTSGGADDLAFFLITVPANEEVAKVHHRMPAIVSHPDDEKLWLSEETDLEKVLPLLKPVHADLRGYEVSSAVNSAKNDDPRNVRPVDQLF
jgi:putative SOS response-associated peptidase YedK